MVFSDLFFFASCWQHMWQWISLTDDGSCIQDPVRWDRGQTFVSSQRSKAQTLSLKALIGVFGNLNNYKALPNPVYRSQSSCLHLRTLKTITAQADRLWCERRHHDRVSSPPECIQTEKFVSFVRSCWRSAPPCTGIMHKYVCLCCQMWNVELVNNCRQVECCVGRLRLVSVRKWRSKCRVWKQRWKENKNTVGEWIKLSCLNVCMSHHVNIA